MNKKSKIITIFAIVVLCLMLITGTYAFFRAQQSGTSSNDISVISKTTDNLSFQISGDINFRVTQVDLAEGGNNKSGNSTATAILTPNNNTGAATMNYYLYLNLIENGINYSSTNTTNQPELMVQVYNGNNQLVTLSGLGEQKTVKGVTGYDITGRQGLIPLLENHAISASNNQPTTENWQVIVTMINLDVDQYDNTNKTVTGEIIIRKDQQLDSPRVGTLVPQSSEGVPKGYVETVIEPIIANEEEIYTIYTVGYILDDTTSGTTYSIDVNNLPVDLLKYDLELDGTPQVMTTQEDYTNYIAMKANGLPLTSLSNGDTNRATATAQELYNYSLDATELSINNVEVKCNGRKCTITISETFNNITGKSKHSTTNSNNEAINVLYNGIKFNLKKRAISDNVTLLTRKYGLYTPENISLNDGYIYYHNSTLANGTNDNSYRYSGANPNNYVCFGSNSTQCPEDNIYRIIGLVPVSVVITESPLTTQTKVLYKLIKHNYLTTNEVTIGSNTYNGGTYSPYETYLGPVGNLAPDPQGYSWSGSENNTSNTWTSSTLNTTGLNGTYLNSLGSTWSNKIANVMWKVGGTNVEYIRKDTPMSTIYRNEILESGQHATYATTDGKNETAAKVGLMYYSDYGYATLENAWSESVGALKNSPNLGGNWLYRGVDEWTISRAPHNEISVYNIWSSGVVGYCRAAINYIGVRPTFYLTEDTVIDMTNHAGTSSDPYRVL